MLHVSGCGEDVDIHSLYTANLNFKQETNKEQDICRTNVAWPARAVYTEFITCVRLVRRGIQFIILLRED